MTPPTVGAGNSEGGLDFANMLKPALARGQLQCIGATTLDEYRQHIEPDPALSRRFQVMGLGLGLGVWGAPSMLARAAGFGLWWWVAVCSSHPFKGSCPNHRPLHTQHNQSSYHTL